ncbi:diguanylate cyclase [Blastomonas sp. UPD001]|uniref:GGDEF domain-containing protein n=1 Tax=Blastomonas sp. UPD001 TaxID=2217673 RepID=UPI000E34856B|nr:diguanylate cyclase [Blastomonas sp. UPD001]
MPPRRWRGPGAHSCDPHALADPRTARRHRDRAGRGLPAWRGAIDGLEFLSPDGDPIALSISVGVAPYRAGWSLDNALAQADAAMYGAKRSGRNRVHAAA